MSDFCFRWFVLLIDVSLKSILLAAVAACVLRVLRIRNGNLKHAAWLGVLLAMMTLPLMSPVLPNIPVPLPVQPGHLFPSSELTGHQIATSHRPESPAVDLLESQVFNDGSSRSTPFKDLSERRLPVDATEIDPIRTDISDASISLPSITHTQTIATELSSEPNPEIVTASNTWAWTLAVMVIWISGAALLLARLVLAILATRRLVERSTLVYESLDDRLSNFTGAKRIANFSCDRLQLRQSAAIFVPLTTGLLRPSILLPGDWTNWPAEKLSHVLVHESTHVRRNDCWTAFAADLATCIYWFHPLAWWLRRQLSLLAEECCDDAAIASTGDRTAYARHLLEIASVLCQRRNRLNYVGLAMARRSQVEHRILTILDLNRPLSQRLTWSATIFIAAVILPLVAFAAALKFADEPNPENPRADTAVTESGVKEPSAGNPEVKETLVAQVTPPPSANDATTDQATIAPADYRVHGRVVDSRTAPIAGAKLTISGVKYPHWTSALAPSRLIAHVTTDADGRYEHLIPAEQLPKTILSPKEVPNFEWLQLAATSTGHGVEISNVDRFHPDQALDFTLRDEAKVHGRVLDLEGRPIPDVAIRVIEVASAEGVKIDAWYAEAVKRQNRDWDESKMLFRGPKMTVKGQEDLSAGATFNLRPFLSTASLPFTRTDTEGQFTLSGLGKDQLAILEISGPNVTTDLINVVTRPMKPVKDFSGGSQMSTGIRTFHGSELEYVASPSAAIHGVVRDIETKQPLAGVIVMSESITGTRMSREGFITTTTDAEGRYRLEGLPPTKGNRLKVVPGELPYLNTGNFSVPESPSLQPIRLDIELRKAVWVTGRVFDRTTGKPVQAKLGYSPFTTNRFTKDYWQYADQVYEIAENSTKTLTDDQGRFRIRVIPGRGVLGAKVPDGGYVAGYGREQIQEWQEGEVATIKSSSDSLEPSWYHSVRGIDPAADATEIEVDLPVDPGASVKLSVVDESGTPVPRIFASSINVPAVQLRSESDQTTLSGLVPGKPMILWFRQQGWKPGETPRQKIQTVTPDAADQQTVIQMERPCHVTGRVVDASGKSLTAEQIGIWYEVNEDTLHSVIVVGSTNSDGRFELDLPTGGKYRLTAVVNGKFGILAEHLQPQPGKAIELGDVKPTESPRKSKETAKAATGLQTEPVADVKNKTMEARIHGRVVNEAGQTLAGAFVGVIAARMTNDQGYVPEVLAETVTDGDGRYELVFKNVSPKAFAIPKLIVRAKDRALAWQTIDLNHSESQFDVTTRPEQPMRVQLIDIQGQPASGVLLDYRGLAPVKGKEEGHEGIWQFPEFKHESKVTLPRLMSDSEGMLTVPHVPADYGVSFVVVSSERFAPQSLHLNFGWPETRQERDGTYRGTIKNFEAGTIGIVPLAPARIFEGTVWLDKTNKPAAYAKLSMWASDQEPWGSMVSIDGQTDANGRFRLNPYPGIRFGIDAYPPTGSPYQIRRLNDLRWESGDSVRKLDIHLPTGVFAEGTIVDAESGKPLAQASVQYYPNDARNKNLLQDTITEWQGMRITDEQGKFQIPVPPGPGTLLVHAPPGSGYVLRQKGRREISRDLPGGKRVYAHAFQSIDPTVQPEGRDPQTAALTIKLQPGGTIAAKLMDTEGHPVMDAIYTSRLLIHPGSPMWRGTAENAKNGVAEIRGIEPRQKYAVYFLDPKRQIGATTEISLDNPNPTIVLQPCASAKVRFIDPGRKPVKKGTWIGLHMVVTPRETSMIPLPITAHLLEADEDFASNFYRSRQEADSGTDENGIEQYGLLVPGATYRFHNYSRDTVEKEFVAKSGEFHDLGEVTIDSQK